MPEFTHSPSRPGAAAAPANPTSLHLPTREFAAKIAMGYAAVGTLWILTSSWMLHRFVTDPVLQEAIELTKGWFYVGATALLLGFVLDRYFRVIRDSARRLQQSEELSKRALEGASQAVWDWNPETNEVSYSLEWKTMLGYEPEDIGNSLSEWESRVHPEDLPRAKAEVRRHLEGQIPFYLSEHRVRCKDGSYKWILDRGKVANRTPDGRPLRMVGTHSDISRRKQAEEALLASEARFRALFEKSTEGIALLDADLKVLSQSPSLDRIQGGYPGERDGRDGLELVHADDLAAARTLFEQLRDKPGGSAVLTLRLRHKDGSWRWQEATVTNHLNDPAVGAFVLNYRDITERKRIEGELRQWADAFKHCAHGIAMAAGGSSRIQVCNPALAHLLGRTVEEITSVEMLSLYTPEDHPRVVEAIAEADRTGQAHYEARKLRPDGTRLLVEVYVASVRDEQGEILYRIASVQEITQRKRAEQTVRDSQRRLNLFFNHSLDGYYFSELDEPQEWNDRTDKVKVLDYIATHQRITEVNEAMLAQYGASREEFLGRPVGRFFQHDVEEGRRLHRRFFDEGRLHIETCERKDDGTPIWIEGDYVCLRDDQHRITGTFGIQRDITERKRAEQELARAYQQASTMAHLGRELAETATPRAAALAILESARQLLNWDSAWLRTWNAEHEHWEDLVAFDRFDGECREVPTSPVPDWQLSPVIRQALKEAQLVQRNTETDGEQLLVPFGSGRRSLSLMFAPMRMAGRLVGILSVQSYTRDAYDRAGLELLQTLADHCAGALERIHASTALAMSEARYRALFDEAPDGIMLVSPDGREITVNGSFARMHGYSSPKDMESLRLSDLDTPVSAPFAEERMRQLVAGAVLSFEVEHYRKDRSVFPLSVTARRVDLGGTWYLQTFHRDVTAQKQVDLALQQSEAKYRLLAENVEDFVTVLDAQEQRIYIAPSFYRVTGWTPEEVLNSPWDARLHPEDIPSIQASRKANLAGETTVLEHRIRCRDGSWMWVEARCKPITGPEGQVERLLIWQHDITQRRQAEAGLRASQALTEGVFNAVAENIAVLNPSGVIVAVNTSWQRFALENPTADGAAPKNCGVGVNYLAVCRQSEGESSEGAVAAAEGIQAVLAGRVPRFAAEYPCHSPTHRRWFQMTVTPLGDGGLGVVVSHSNTTERREVEEALRQRLELQDQLAKVAATVPGLICSLRLRPDGSLCMPFATPAIQGVWGLQADDVRDDFSPAFAQIHPADREPLRESLTESARTLRPWHEVFRIQHPQRGRVWLEGLSVPCREADGSTLWHGFVQDVTERKLAEVEVRRQDTRLRLALEAAEMVTWELDIATGRLAYSSNLAALAESEDVTPYLSLDSFMQQIHPEDQGKVDKAIIQTIRTGVPFDCEYRVHLPDGSWHWLSAKGRAVAGAEGRFSQVLGVSQDTTQRKRLEGELQDALIKYQTLFDAFPLGITVADREGRIIETNRIAEVILGLSAEQHLQRTIGGAEWRIVRPDGTPMPPEEFASVVALREQRLVANVEMGLVKSPAETTWIAVTAAPVPLPGVGVVVAFSDVTARKRTEEDLRHSEFKYRVVADNTFDWEFWLSPEGRYLYSSPSCERVTGHTPAEFEADPELMEKIVHPEDLSRFQAHHRLSLDGEQEAEQEFRILRPDGEVRWIGHVCAPIRDEAGVFLGVRGSNRDITERKRAESRLTMLNRCLLEFGPDADQNINTLVRFLGEHLEAACALYNRLEGGQLHALGQWQVPPDFKSVDEPAGHICYDVIRGGEPQPKVIRNLLQSDYARTDPNVLRYGLRTYVGRAVSLGGACIGSLCVVYQVDREPGAADLNLLGIVTSAIGAEEKRKQAEAAIRESGIRFRALIENAPDGVVLVNQEGVMTYASPSACRIFGVNPAKVREVNPAARTHPEDLPRVLAALEELLRNPAGVTTLEYRFQHADQTWLWIESTFTNLVGLPGVDAIVINFREIDDRKLAEAALRDSEELLQEMGRVAKVGGWEFEAATGEGRWTDEVARIHDLDPTVQTNAALGLSFYHGESRVRIEAAIEQAITQGTPYDLELEIVSAKGAHKWVHTIGQPVMEDGRVVRLRGAFQDITERKRAEAALRESEERFRTVVEGASISVLVATDLEFRYLNPAALRLFGAKAPEELIGQPVLPRIHPDFHNLVRDRVEKVQRGDCSEAPPVREVYLRLDGAPVEVEVSAAPLTYQGRSAAVVFVQDITERLRAEAALRESEDRYRSLVEDSPDAIGILQDDQLVFINTTGVRQFGARDKAELLGLKGEQVIHLEDQKLAQDRIRRRLEGDSAVYPAEVRYLRLDGTPMPVEVSAAPVQFAGRPAVQFIARDITERKRAEEALRQSQEMLEKAQRYGHIGSWVAEVGVPGRLAWSDETCRLFGLEPGQFDGTSKSFFQLVHPEDRDRLRNAGREADSTGKAYRVDYRILRPDGELRWMHQRAEMEFDGTGRPWRKIGTVQDITERRRAEEELQAQRDFAMQVMNNMGQGLTVTGPDGNFQFVNPAYARMIGRRPEELVGTSPGSVNCLDDLPVLAQAQAARVRGEHTDYEVRLVHADGRLVPVRITGVPRWDHDQVSGAIAVITDLTEQKQAEAALRESLLFRREAEKIGRIGAWKVNPETDYLYWTEGVYEIIGVPLNQRPGLREGLKFYDAESIPVLQAALEAALKDGTPFTVEAGVTTLNGQHLWTEVRGLGRLEEKGQAYVMGTVQDITERKQTEAALRQSEAEFRTMFELASIGMAQADPLSGRWLRVNEKLCQITGYNADEMRQLCVPEITHPEDRQYDWDLFQEVVRGETKDYRLEKRYVRKDRQTVWVNVNMTLVRDARGQPLRTLATVEDISGRKRAEAELRTSEQRYRTVMDAMTDSIHVVDRDLHIVLVNETCRRWCEQSGLAEPCAGQSLLEALPFLPPEAVETHRQVFSAGAPMDSIGKKIRLGGKDLIVDIRLIPIQEHGNTERMMAVIRDVTEHTRLEVQFLRAQRMESLGTLATGIAHDLNNVLAPMMLVAPMVREQLPDPATRSLMESAEASVQRGADIIRQLLVFSRGIEGEKVPLRLADLVKEIVKIEHEVFPKSLKIHTDLPRDLWLVSGNSTHLHQVLMNLSVNARDAMPHGGTLNYSAENVVIDETYAGLSSWALPGAFVVLKVRDTGTGIPPHLIEKIFDPFFTTKEVGKGTGLGLSTVQGIVKSHGGFIEVDSQVGQGTEFRVFLPAIQTTAGGSRETAREDAVRGRGQTLLVVDDEPTVRRVLEKTLERYGYRVLSARDGVEALTVFLAHQAHIAAVITDLAMPDMNGLALARSLKTSDPHLQIIVSTGHAEASQREAFEAMGVTLFLEKPYKAGPLLAAVQKALGDEAGRSSHAGR